MKSTIVCLVIAAVFVYASAMPADGDANTTAAPETTATEDPPGVTTVVPEGETTPEAPSDPEQTPSNPIMDIKGFIEKGITDIAAGFWQFRPLGRPFRQQP